MNYYNSGGQLTSWIAVGDFNGDGNQDLASAAWYSNNISVNLGRGDGTFGDPVIYGSGGNNPWSVVVADSMVTVVTTLPSQI